MIFVFSDFSLLLCKPLKQQPQQINYIDMQEMGNGPFVK